jgi:hypothetical protein
VIKDKNIDPSTNFPISWVSLGKTGAVAATNVAVAQFCAPYAGKVVKAVYSLLACSTSTGTIDIIRGTTAAVTTGTSIFAAAHTNATTAQSAADITTELSASAAQFAAGEFLQLKIANCTITDALVHIGIRPLLAKEISGY